jgi:hypothetical protein
MEWKCIIITRPSKMFTLITGKDKVRKEKGFIETGDYRVCVEVRRKYAGWKGLLPENGRAASASGINSGLVLSLSGKGSNLSGWASGISEQHQSRPNAFLMGKNLRYFRIIKMWLWLVWLDTSLGFHAKGWADGGIKRSAFPSFSISLDRVFLS